MADNKRKLAFDVPTFFNEKGVQFDRVEGDIAYGTVDGREVKFDPKQHLLSKGLVPNDVNISLNSPSTALPESPVSLTDRAKIALGNKAGAKAFLKNKFEDVSVHEENGIVVKENGVWKQVDPNNFGDMDAWSLSELLADSIEFGAASAAGAVGAGVGAAKGALAGGAVAGPPGAVAGGFAGVALGGGTGEAVRTSLGRYMGTYKATPEEQLEDIALESLLSLGGQVIPVGARKLVGSKFGKAMKNLGKNASEGAKDLLASLYGKTTKAGASATRTMMDRTDDVLKTMRQAASEAKARPGTDAFLDKVGEKQVRIAEDILSQADSKLPEMYRQQLDSLLSTAEKKGFAVNIGDVVKSTRKSIEDAGFGKFVNGDLVPLDATDIVTRTAQGLPAEDLASDPKTLRQIKGLLKSVGKFENVGELKGKAAANVLSGLNKTINGKQRELLRVQDTPEAVRRLLAKSTEGFRQAVGETFEKQGLAAEYAGLSSLYAEFGDSVTSARKILKSNGMEQFLNKLRSKGGRGLTAKTTAQNLIDLLGPAGEELVAELDVLDAAGKFSALEPKLNLFQTGAIVGGSAAAAATNPAAWPVIAGAASQFSPRTVLAQKQLLNGAMRLMDNIKGMTPQQINSFIKNPDAIRTSFQIVGDSIKEENELKSVLFQDLLEKQELENMSKEASGR